MDAEQAERPGARRGELRHRRQRLLEELAGHDLEARGTASGRRPGPSAQSARPWQSSEPCVLQPAAVEAQEVAEPPRAGIEGVLQERRVGRGQRPHALRLLPQLFQQHGEHEGAGVVVGAVALGEVRHGEDGVLEDAGRVGHPREVVELQLRQLARLLVERLDGERLARQRRPLAPRLLERLHVQPRHVAPDHLAAQLVGVLAHRVPPRLVAQQAAHLARNGLGVAERHEHAAVRRPAVPRRASTASRRPPCPRRTRRPACPR